MPGRAGRYLLGHLVAGLAAALELPGRVAFTWAAASGMLAGGAWVGVLAMTGRTSASVSWFLSTLFFVVFGALGFLHGAVLGYLGRPRDQRRGRVFRSIAWAAVLGSPLLALAYEVAIWVSMTELALLRPRSGLMIGVALGWLLMLAACTLAVQYGVAALRCAYSHWSDCALGTLLIAITFAFLLVSFLSEPPSLFGTDLRVTGPGALLLAAGVTAWIASPVVVIALQLMHRRLHRSVRPLRRVL